MLPEVGGAFSFIAWLCMHFLQHPCVFGHVFDKPFTKARSTLNNYFIVLNSKSRVLNICAWLKNTYYLFLKGNFTLSLKQQITTQFYAAYDK